MGGTQKPIMSHEADHVDLSLLWVFLGIMFISCVAVWCMACNKWKSRIKKCCGCGGSRADRTDLRTDHEQTIQNYNQARRTVDARRRQRDNVHPPLRGIDVHDEDDTS